MHPRWLVILRLAFLVLAVAPLTLAVPALLQQEPSPADDGGGSVAPLERSAVILRRGSPILGYAIVAHHIGDLDLYLKSVEQIADLGANALVVVTPMFVERADSNEIRYLPKRCPTDAQLIAILEAAHEHGLVTALQPIVLIERPEKNEWRGVLAPKNWPKWWASYDRLLDRFLGIANAADVDLLTIGSELNSTEGQTQRWREVVDKVRSGYSGAITYSANWDRYDKIHIWPLVDVLSVSAYFELQRDDPDAAESALVADWISQRDLLLDRARHWERPLLLSEVGYPSLPWASAHPWNYVAPSGAVADHEAQARCYRAFFSAWTDTLVRQRSGSLGFFCYHWDPYHHGRDTDTGYGVQGKPAYSVIKEAFGRIRDGAAAGTDPTPETAPQ